jgi:hypothetical protein
MPNQIGPHLEQRVIAFSPGHPGYGPGRIRAELAREKWGGIEVCQHGVWRVRCRVGLNTTSKRLALPARHRDHLRAQARSIYASDPIGYWKAPFLTLSGATATTLPLLIWMRTGGGRVLSWKWSPLDWNLIGP